MSLVTKTPSEHLAMCGQIVYGLVDDKIDQLSVESVKIEQKKGSAPEVMYVLKNLSDNVSEYSISPLNVFESVDELLTQMAADFQKRTSKKSKKQ